MTDLPTRIEQVTGPSRELDAEIALACGWKPAKKIDNSPDCLWVYPDRRDARWGVPFFTYSLDAAITLVREESFFSLRTYHGWGIKVVVGGYVGKSTAPNGTPALALCAAALRAREADGKDHG